MALSKSLISLGNWIESHFPEKLTAAEVRHEITDMANHVAVLDTAVMESNKRVESLLVRVTELEKKAEILNSDVNKTKVMLITQRQTAGR